jgi:hypothetical protein
MTAPVIVGLQRQLLGRIQLDDSVDVAPGGRDQRLPTCDGLGLAWFLTQRAHRKTARPVDWAGSRVTSIVLALLAALGSNQRSHRAAERLHKLPPIRAASRRFACLIGLPKLIP